MALLVKRCTRCGRSGMSLQVTTCLDCAKIVCPGCMVNNNMEGLCLDCYQNRVNSTSASIINRWGNCCPICGSFGTLNLTNLYFYRVPMPTQMSSAAPLNFSFSLRCDSCWNEIHEGSLSVLNEATRAERAGRYEDAAMGYERLNLLDKARNLRERGRTSTVRQVNVDLNSLIEQLKMGGLTVPYRCQGCGATLTIDSKTGDGGLRYCSYCGSAIDVELLSRMIQQALG
ncbi:MAG: hypothetical protein A4E32_00523 [Methanomassiliicoccales archaeon PtaU1.Bin124]|nr:MAG: hypothetical protein A4E32_00523 [Methanomassiliicoccales archaeon PtaU1.Bin124]